MKVIEHFNELTAYLRRIEIMEKEIKLEDMKSTVGFIRVASFCGIALFGVAFVLDFSPHFIPALTYIDEGFSSLIGLLF